MFDPNSDGSANSCPNALPCVEIPLLREERRLARTRRLTWLGTLVGVLLLGGLASLGPEAWQAVAAHMRPGSSTATRTDGAVPPAAKRAASIVPTAAALTTAPSTPPPTGTPAQEGSVSESTASASAASPAAAATTTTAAVATSQPPPAVPAPALAATASAVRTERVSRAFGHARSFHDALIAAAVTATDAMAVENSLSRVVDFRRCRADDSLIFELDSAGILQTFEYRRSPTEVFRATRNATGSGFRGQRIEIPTTHTRLSRGGRIESSLVAGLAQVGLGSAVLGMFLEAFEGRANFSTEAWRGDTFRIIVDEERVDGTFLRYGTVHAIEYVGQRTGRLRAIWFQPSPSEPGDFYDESGRAIRSSWLRTPCRYDRISSRFDLRRRHPILHRIIAHTGVDYSARTGTIARAAADGVVVFAGPKGPNGNLVGIRHANGDETYYAHLHRIERGIRPGVTVRQRQVIGYVGSTGRSTGPHLHFALKRNGQFIDPLQELTGPGRLLPPGQLARFRPLAQRVAAELDRVTLPAVTIVPLAPRLEDNRDEALD